MYFSLRLRNMQYMMKKKLRVSRSYKKQFPIISAVFLSFILKHGADKKTFVE